MPPGPPRPPNPCAAPAAAPLPASAAAGASGVAEAVAAPVGVAAAPAAGTAPGAPRPRPPRFWLNDSNCNSVTTPGCGSSTVSQPPGVWGTPEFQPRRVAAPTAAAGAWLAVN